MDLKTEIAALRRIGFRHRVLDTCYAWRMDRPIVKVQDDYLEYDFWPFLEDTTSLNDFFDNLVQLQTPATRGGWMRIFRMARSLEGGRWAETPIGHIVKRHRGAA